MKIFRPLSLLLLILAACHTKGTNGSFAELLNKPPYDEWTKRIQAQPDNDSLYYQRARLLMINEQDSAARLDLEKAWSLHHNPVYAVELSLLLENTPVEQLAFLQKAVTIVPGNLAIEYALADAHWQNGSIDSALRYTTRWYATGIREVDPILLHASLLYQKGKTNEATEILSLLLKDHPDDQQILRQLTAWYAEMGNPLTVTYCNALRATDTLGNDPTPYYYLGIYYTTLKQSAEAIRQFDQAIVTDYNFVEAYIEKAVLLYEMKNYKESVGLLDKALAVAPDYASVYYWTAKCQQALGDKESARSNYLKAYGLDKSFQEAKQAADELK
ncbi:MAG: tetratricopeptide repeat protein [Bacteroidota bacterium]